MTTPVEFLMNGSIVQAVLTTYTNLLGFWFYVILAFTFVTASYMKSQNVVFPVMMAILMAVGLGAYGIFPSSYVWIMLSVAVLGTAILLFSLYYKK